jgi:hypothetical protein
MLFLIFDRIQKTLLSFIFKNKTYKLFITIQINVFYILYRPKLFFFSKGYYAAMPLPVISFPFSVSVLTTKMEMKRITENHAF